MDTYQTAKNEFVRLYDVAKSEKAKCFWEKRIAWCDKKIRQSRSRELELARRLKIFVIVISLAVIATICTSCQTVKGVTGDAGWILTEMSNNIQVQEK